VDQRAYSQLARGGPLKEALESVAAHAEVVRVTSDTASAAEGDDAEAVGLLLRRK
jgi:hypothetical protein